MPSSVFSAYSAVAQTNPVRPEVGSDSTGFEFDEHHRFRPFRPRRETRAKWEVNINFIDTLIDAKWIIHIEQQLRSGEWVLTDEYIMDLECQKQGDIDIQNDIATFNPATGDYISCDIPSYRAAVKQLLDMFIDPRCNCVDPWVNAALRTTPNRQREYPVISLNTVIDPSAVFDATIRRQGRRQAHVEIMMSDWDFPETSNSFNIRQPQIFLAGINLIRFIKTLNERHNRYQDIWTEFWTSTNLGAYLSIFNLDFQNIWLSWIESHGNQQSVVEAQNTTMYTEEMTLYIGYNPATQKYFRGEMTHIGVDPGCVGIGGR